MVDFFGRTAFLSTCGNLSVRIKEGLEMVFNMASEREQTIVLALDNDLAGRRMTKELVDMAEAAGCPIKIEKPKIGKDWNDMLRDKDIKDLYSVEKGIAQTKWEVFEETEYKNSLLEKLSLSKETLDAFKDTLKANESSMVVALNAIGEKEISATLALGNEF